MRPVVYDPCTETLRLVPVGSSREVSLDAHRVQTTIAQPLTPTQLDLDSITNASRLLSAETDLEQLFAKMMTLVIAIRAKREGDRVKVSVADRGPGIPEAERQKLFQPFGRTGMPTTGGEKSVGLGLMLVKKIVEAHDGQIDVESDLCNWPQKLDHVLR
jgi:light-regulated signal transduction histidine kinase (bacteriophytochrome)